MQSIPSYHYVSSVTLKVYSNSVLYSPDHFIQGRFKVLCSHFAKLSQAVCTGTFNIFTENSERMDRSIWNQGREHLMILDENHAIIRSCVEYMHLFTPLSVGGVVCSHISLQWYIYIQSLLTVHINSEAFGTMLHSI